MCSSDLVFAKDAKLQEALDAGADFAGGLDLSLIHIFGVEKHEIVVAYSEGDNVRVADGPLTGFIGVVDLVDIEKNKVRVIVSMFGRETPVELELDQVEVINQ